ncbi:uncharacterized protein K460DRAFT_362517 [Cucurbitaria berberidis CBS 394.84]|uniref:Uncharacterized protein n=1 Tax=Cucurbitaria berberidis CBS 394.84 TaxID=1168544 RepID=A0A9P4LEV8_9PLEO|nr:uncharacterized protein K460DRAFT_362517 [Cucurbitaria berberidis CBS 394.84]KAF1851767.1 hypothetical protein K460DRAFT_362517 [Cucurbitaria berberidis CBS 394.84]
MHHSVGVTVVASHQRAWGRHFGGVQYQAGLLLAIELYSQAWAANALAGREAFRLTPFQTAHSICAHLSCVLVTASDVEMRCGRQLNYHSSHVRLAAVVSPLRAFSNNEVGSMAGKHGSDR